MERVSIEVVENRVQPAAVMRTLTEELGLEDCALNYYELEPGDSFAFAYHNHAVQEEIFYVLAGEATFETAEGPVTVRAREAVRFDRGEFQRGWNRGEDRLTALAMGAPLAYGKQVKLRDCATCGLRTDARLDYDEADAAVVASCRECGAETGRWHRGSMEGTVP